jgi:hypothetical protein
VYSCTADSTLTCVCLLCVSYHLAEEPRQRHLWLHRPQPQLDPRSQAGCWALGQGAGLLHSQQGLWLHLQRGSKVRDRKSGGVVSYK